MNWVHFCLAGWVKFGSDPSPTNATWLPPLARVSKMKKAITGTKCKINFQSKSNFAAFPL